MAAASACGGSIEKWQLAAKKRLKKAAHIVAACCANWQTMTVLA